MLASACFSNDASFSDALGEQCLTEHIVDFVRTGVVEVFAFEKNARSPAVLRKSRRLGEQ